MEHQKKDNSAETTMKNDKLSILLDNTGFHSLGPMFGIDIEKCKKKGTPKVVLDKRLLHLLPRNSGDREFWGHNT